MANPKPNPNPNPSRNPKESYRYREIKTDDDAVITKLRQELASMLKDKEDGLTLTSREALDVNPEAETKERGEVKKANSNNMEPQNAVEAEKYDMKAAQQEIEALQAEMLEMRKRIKGLDAEKKKLHCIASWGSLSMKKLEELERTWNRSQPER